MTSQELKHKIADNSQAWAIEYADMTLYLYSNGASEPTYYAEQSTVLRFDLPWQYVAIKGKEMWHDGNCMFTISDLGDQIKSCVPFSSDKFVMLRTHADEW